MIGCEAISVKQSISIIIPTYNEEKNIARIVKACKDIGKIFKTEIIVVDGGSVDKTVEIAKKSKVDKIIAFPFKRGKGADFWAGGLVSCGDYIIQIDADFQFMPSEIPLFVEQLDRGADVVIASRFGGGKIEKGSITARNLIGNWLISALVSLAVGRRITDVMAGFKGFRREAFLALDLRERHFEYEAEVVVKAIRRGMNLVEVPITYKRRRSGQSGIRAIRDGLNVMRAIIVARLLS